MEMEIIYLNVINIGLEMKDNNGKIIFNIIHWEKVIVMLGLMMKLFVQFQVKLEEIKDILGVKINMVQVLLTVMDK
jgi:hypothetical protein